jgi:hypothetical protein
MSVHTIPNCEDVTDCSQTSWDLLFCICSPNLAGGGICADADDIYTLSTADTIPSLQGVYSTDCQSVTTGSPTFPGISTGAAVAGGWSNLSNAQHDDGSYAIYTYQTGDTGPPPDAVSSPGPAGEYIVFSDFGFSIPSTATIYGLSIGIKGYYTCPVIPSGLISHARPIVWNVFAKTGGTRYYMCDPSSYVVTDSTGLASAVGASAPWPVTGLQSGLIPTSYQVLTPLIDPGGFALYRAINNVQGRMTTVWPGVSLPLSGENVGESVVFPGALYTPYDYPDWPYNNGAVMGYVNGCRDSIPFGGQPTFSVGPIEKSFIQTPTKATWTPAEVNDTSFGVGISFSFSPTRFAHGGGVNWNILINCAAVAVYYTDSIGGNPFANCNGVEFR